MNISHALEALEATADSKQALISYHLPELDRVVETIKLLPRDQQEEYLGRLERISMILEGQMLELSEELEELRKQIPMVQQTKTAAFRYRRTAAIIPVKPSKGTN